MKVLWGQGGCVDRRGRAAPRERGRGAHPQSCGKVLGWPKVTHCVRGTEPGCPSVLLCVAAAGASVVSAIGAPETPACTATVAVTVVPCCVTALAL